MTTPEMVKVYVSQLCAEIGCTPESVYSEQYQSWSFTRGSAVIEVFMNSYVTAAQTVRTFLRCFSPVCVLPVDNLQKMQLFQEALQHNANYMGVKLAIMPDKGFMYAVAERDINGMDYAEFNTLIGDLGYWADQLDNILQERFGPRTAMN